MEGNARAMSMRVPQARTPVSSRGWPTHTGDDADGGGDAFLEAPPHDHSTSRLIIAAARDALEGLQEVTAGGDPYALAPQRWIDELHETLAVIATRDAQRRYRLDHLSGINRGYLHSRVQAVLQDFDQLVDERPLWRDYAGRT